MKATLKLHLSVTKDADGMWTATCAEVPAVVTCAETRDRLFVPMMDDALRGWLDIQDKRGQLDQEFERLGLHPDTTEVAFDFFVKEEADSPAYVRAAS